MQDFDIKFGAFIQKCQELSDQYMEEQFSNLPKPEVVPNTGGKSFIRVVRKEPGQQSGSAHCFVAAKDGSNKKLGSWKMGDVFKADGWASPARGVRGNIFDDKNGMGRMGPYGPAYNR